MKLVVVSLLLLALVVATTATGDIGGGEQLQKKEQQKNKEQGKIIIKKEQKTGNEQQTDKEQKKRVQLDNKFAEIKTTESKYVRILANLCAMSKDSEQGTDEHKQLRKVMADLLSLDDTLSESTRKTLGQLLQIACPLHEKHKQLLKSVDDLSKKEAKERVAGAVKLLGQFLTDNYDLIVQALTLFVNFKTQTQSKNSPKFTEAFGKLKQDVKIIVKQDADKEVDSGLATMFQRLPRYVLLLQELVSNAREAGVDVTKRTQDELKYVQDVVNDINKQLPLLVTPKIEKKIEQKQHKGVKGVKKRESVTQKFKNMFVSSSSIDDNDVAAGDGDVDGADTDGDDTDDDDAADDF